MCIIIMLNQWQKWVPKSFTVHFVATTLVYQFRLDWVKSQQRLARLTDFHLVFDFAIRTFFCARDILPAADNINIIDKLREKHIINTKILFLFQSMKEACRNYRLVFCHAETANESLQVHSPALRVNASFRHACL